MKISQLQEQRMLPLQAGRAVLWWEGTHRPFPFVRVLKLPLNPEADFYPIRGGRQFLLGNEQEKTVLWGGTDTYGIFLTSLKSDAMFILRNERDNGFFQILRSEPFFSVSACLSYCWSQIGPVFLSPLQFSWGELNALSLLFSGRERLGHTHDTYELFEGWGRVDGHCAQLINWKDDWGQEIYLAEGDLTVEEHDPPLKMKLLEVHLFTRAALWVPPEEAGK